MIQFLANRTAKYIARGDDTADVEILTYGYYLFYQTTVTAAVLLLIALPFGLFFHVLASLAASMILRGPAGGAHAKYAIVCRIVSFFQAFIPALLGELFADRLFAFWWSLPIVFVLYIFSIALLVKYAPGETDVTKIPDLAKRREMKRNACIWTTALFIIAMVLHIWLPAIAFVVIVTTTIVCCFVHPWVYWLFGFDPVTREVRR